MITHNLQDIYGRPLDLIHHGTAAAQIGHISWQDNTNHGQAVAARPDAEWVLMYRLGLSRKRIAELVGVVGAQPATVGYHLVIARRRDPAIDPLSAQWLLEDISD